MKGPTFVLLALMAATAAVAQVTPAPSSAEPPPSATPEEQNPSPTTPPADSSASPNSADTQALMKDCLSQVKAANPNVSDQDIQRFCENEISKATAPRN
jgi:hypothetical protein